MPGVHLVHTIVRKNTTRPRTLTTRGFHAARRGVGEQEHVRKSKRHPLRMSNRGGVADRWPAERDIGKTTHTPPDQHIKFKFNFDPLKDFTFPSAQSQSSESMLDNSRHRNIELGRLRISQFRTPESAMQALRNAYYRDREQDQRMRQVWQRNHWLHQDELWHAVGCKSGKAVSYKQQKLGILEAAREHATELEKLTTSHTLHELSAAAATAEQMYPFERQLSLQFELRYLVSVAPYRSLQEFSIPFRNSVADSEILIKDLRYWRAGVNHPSRFRKRFNAVKLAVHGRLLSLTTAQESLWGPCSDLLQLWARDKPAAFGRLHILLKSFRGSLQSFEGTIQSIAKDLILIKMIRYNSKAGEQQNIFNALHHHFKLVRSSSIHFNKSTQRSYVDLCAEEYQFNQRSDRKNSILTAHRFAIRRLLSKIESNMMKIMEQYHDDFLSLWIPYIERMSPSEVERQNQVAQRYWIQQLNPNTEYELREMQFVKLHNKLRGARNGLRERRSGTGSTLTNHLRTLRFHEQARQAIEDLSQLYLSDKRQTTESPALASNPIHQPGFSYKRVQLQSRPPIVRSEKEKRDWKWQTKHKRLALPSREAA